MLPLGYDDLTLKQYDAITKVGQNDTIGFLCALSGLDRETWEQVEVIDIDNIVAPNLQWLSVAFDPMLWPLKGTVNILGENYSYPKDIMVCKYGQRLHLERIIEQIQKNELDESHAAAEVMAIIMQPIISEGGKYDSDAVELLSKNIFESCKVIEALPLTSFFLSKHLIYLQLKEKDYLMSLLQKSFKQGSKDSGSSKNLAHYTLYQRPFVFLWRKFYKWMLARSILYNGTNLNLVSTKKS